MNKKPNAWNNPILMTFLIVYLGFTLLFAWQTWGLIQWLFPSDQLLARILTLFSFDIMAMLWAVAHTFFHFASRGAKAWVVIAWVISFTLSFVATVMYLVIQFYFRFSLSIDPSVVNIGYAVSIVALVFNMLAITAFLILEYRARNPRQDEFDIADAPTLLLPVVKAPTASLASVDANTDRLKRLAEAAAAKGYDIEKLESMLGIPAASNGHVGKTTKKA